jgi:uncharacterized protein (TIGR02145 family)
MRTISKTLYFLLLVIIFSCAKEQNNPYDRECPPEIWSPTNLNTSSSSGVVILSWEQEATHFGGFLLERSADSINWLQVNSSLIDRSKRTYTDSGNLPGGKVYYRVSAKADKNQSNYSYAKAICLVPPAPGAITGKTTVQQNETGVTYSIAAVSGATSYNWTIPTGATFVSGQGTTGIKVNFGASGGNVGVRSENSCGNSAYTNLSVTTCQLPAVPGAISGKATVQQNEAGVSYFITAVSGATSYNWTIPTGATFVSGQGTTSITVNFGINGGNVGVRSENSCGNSAYTNLAVTTCQIPAVPGTITGKTTVQQNEAGVSYSIEVVSGATSYNWTIPTGASFVSGQGTTSIKVNFGTTAGNIGVFSVNDCGNSGYTYLSISTAGNCSFGSFTDSRDGIIYKTIKVGTQVWMAENLAYLPSVNLDSDGSYTESKYYVYGYEGTNVSEAKAKVNYVNCGVLYNWVAAMNGESSSNSVPSGVRGICPVGWHIPSDSEWSLFGNFLISSGFNYDGSTSGNKVAKSLALSGLWTDSQVTGSAGNSDFNTIQNKTCFSANPAGHRNYLGSFVGLRDVSTWWTSSEESGSFAWHRTIAYNLIDMWRDSNMKEVGFSVRCVKD